MTDKKMNGTTPKKAKPPKPVNPAFRAYDVRGHYPSEIDDVMALKFAHAFAKVSGCKTVVIGNDLRVGSKAIAPALVSAFTGAGVAVIDIGACTTEQVVYTTGTYDHEGHAPDAGIMVTASHCPMDQTGFKIIGPEAAPLSPMDMQAIYAAYAENTPLIMDKIGDVIEHYCEADHVGYLMTLLNDYGDWTVEPDQPEFLVVFHDGAGKAGVAYWDTLHLLGIAGKQVTLYRASDVKPDMPAKPDPSHPENLAAMKQVILETGAKLGIAWDADGDRALFFDEKGDPMNGAYAGAFLGAVAAQRHPRETLVMDHRVCFPMLNVALNNKTNYRVSLPGHGFMKLSMRDSAAAFGAELSGHYYFKEFFWSESGVLAALLMTQLAYLLPPGETLSKWHDTVSIQFPTIPETNFKLKHPEAVFYALREVLKETANLTEGIWELVARSLDKNHDWRLVFRMSNTEDVMRLTMEGRGNREGLLAVHNTIRNLIENVDSRGMH